MSAGGLARLGVRCADASTGMATIGVYCGSLEELDGPRPGGGTSRRRTPFEHPNRALALREDEELVIMIEALFNRGRKH